MSVTRKIKIKIAEPDVFEEKDIGAEAQYVRFDDNTNAQNFKSNVESTLNSLSGNMETTLKKNILQPDTALFFTLEYLFGILNYELTIENSYIKNSSIIFYKDNDTIIIDESYYDHEKYKINFIITLKIQNSSTALNYKEIALTQVDLQLTDKETGAIYTNGQMVTIQKPNPDYNPEDENSSEYIEVQEIISVNLDYNFAIKNIAFFN